MSGSERMWLWMWWYLVVVVMRQTSGLPCLPDVEFKGASFNASRPWMHVTWKLTQVETKEISTEECPVPPYNLKFCWYQSFQQGSQPAPVDCDTVARCTQVVGRVVEYKPYDLQIANYTMQVAVIHPDTTEKHRCFTAYFVVPPTPRVPLNFKGGPEVTQSIIDSWQKLEYLVGGGRDIDKNPEPHLTDVIKLELKWECLTNDRYAKTWCNGSMDHIPEQVFITRNIVDHPDLFPPETENFAKGAVTGSNVRHGAWYQMTVHAKEKVWPFRVAKSIVQKRVINNNYPRYLGNMGFQCGRPCKLLQIDPTKILNMSVVAWSTYTYRWQITQKDIGPIDLVQNSTQGKSEGKGFGVVTIKTGVFTPNAEVTINLTVF